MTDKELLKLILKEQAYSTSLGKFIFNMETQHGFPFEMTIEEMKDRLLLLTPHQKLLVMNDYLCCMTNHKIKSGVEFMGSNHKRIIEKNKERIKEVYLTNNFI